MTVRRTGWFAAYGQFVGEAGNWAISYTWDGSVHQTREAAISSGFQAIACDDFNVGRIEDDRLVWWGWMDEEHPAEDRASVAADLGLDVAS